MKKKVIQRCLLGAPIGVLISLLITIIISYAIGDGAFHAVTPELSAECGSEINAVAVQTACSLLYGAAWAGASVIWEIEDWSLLKMTAVHFAVSSLSALPIAYFLHWMDRSVAGFLGYFGIFIAIYAGVWCSQYFSIKSRLKKINEALDR